MDLQQEPNFWIFYQVGIIDVSVPQLSRPFFLCRP